MSTAVPISNPVRFALIILKRVRPELSTTLGPLLVAVLDTCERKSEEE